MVDPCFLSHLFSLICPMFFFNPRWVGMPEIPPIVIKRLEAIQVLHEERASIEEVGNYGLCLDVQIRLLKFVCASHIF
jgi:hypothetical protein